MTCELPRYCVPKGGTFQLMARLMGWDGTAMKQTDISGITYSVYSVNPATDEMTVVAGYSGVALTVANVIYDTLQLDNWNEDLIGYNFLYTVDVEANGSPFVERGKTYIVEFIIDPSASGEQNIVAPIEVEVL